MKNRIVVFATSIVFFALIMDCSAQFIRPVRVPVPRPMPPLPPIPPKLNDLPPLPPTPIVITDPWGNSPNGGGSPNGGSSYGSPPDPPRSLPVYLVVTILDLDDEQYDKERQWIYDMYETHQLWEELRPLIHDVASRALTGAPNLTIAIPQRIAVAAIERLADKSIELMQDRIVQGFIKLQPYPSETPEEKLAKWNVVAEEERKLKSLVEQALEDSHRGNQWTEVSTENTNSSTFRFNYGEAYQQLCHINMTADWGD